MKWLFAALVLVNMALYLWASGLERHSSSTNGATRPPVNEKSMRLLNEVTLGEVGNETVELSALLPQQCVRVGPFSEDETFNKATEVFDEFDLAYDRQTVNARQVQSFRVQMGPFDEAVEMETEIAKLQEMGIDAYPVKSAQGEDVISLQLFPQQGAAENLVTELAGQGFQADISREVDSLGPFRWLEASYTQAATLEGLRSTDWGEPQVQVQSAACDSTKDG